MAGPLAGISAQQIAQQAQNKPQQQLKQPGNSFEDSMQAQAGDHASRAQQIQQPQSIQATQQVQQTNKVDHVAHVHKTHMKKIKGAALDDNATGKGADPVAQKSEVSRSTSTLTEMFSGMEKGQASLDKLISGGLSGKNFSNAELMSLQAGMYKYTQEVELTGKVVEKATSGLKDTLKTQV